MARFTDNVSNYFTIASWPVASLPFSVSMWVRFGSFTSNTLLCRILHSTTFHEFGLQVDGTGRALAQTRNALSGTSNSSGGASLTTGAWFQVGGIWRSGNNYRNHWVNGVAGTAETTTRAVTISGQNAQILRIAPASGVEIADLTVWNADIGTDGMLQHAKGFSGRLIRPEALLLHAPFVRGETEHRAGIAVTENGTVSVTSHAPIIGAIAA